MSKFDRTELLAMLMYGLDLALQPTMRNLFHGDEYWLDYAARHRSQLGAMAADGLIERIGRRNQDGWALRLTEAGRLQAIGGRDAPTRWARQWAGEWNLLMFDLETGTGKLRQKLLRWLRANDFGCLQQSVWITPDPVGGELDALLEDYRDRADHILVLRSQIATGKNQAADPGSVAALAWDFDSINAGYREYLDFAKTAQPKRPTPAGARAWVRAEQATWSRAFRQDPLLPDPLQPKGYLGHEAWEKRQRTLRAAAPMVVALQGESTE